MPDDYSTYDKYRYLASIISLITSYDYSDEGGWQSCNRYSHKLTTADILVENEYLTYRITDDKDTKFLEWKFKTGKFICIFSNYCK